MLCGIPLQATPMEEKSKKAAAAPEHAVLIDINTNTTLLSSISERLGTIDGEHKKGQRFTVFRVPAHIREANRDLYEPKIVSIGPYHRGSNRLRAMEDHKWRCLHGLLSSAPGRSLEDYVAKVKQLETEARNCYSETIALSSDEFAQMLLLDCCLIIQFLLNSQLALHGLCEVSWIRELVRSDLLLLENQIPFFVLQAIFDLTSDSAKPSLTNLAIGFLSQAQYEVYHEVDHLLHLYHSCIIDRPDKNKCGPRSSGLVSWIGSWPCRSLRSSKFRRPKTIPCASKLHEAGVAFRRKESASLLDVTFRNGTIEIPHLSIEASTRSRFVNLVAFEQCFTRCKKSLTSYAVFMNCLVRTPSDVGMLQHYGIIENRLSNFMEAAQFFNQFCDCAYLDYEDHCLMELFQDVRDYCDSHWPRWRARLVREYFSSPWAILSFSAALILLGLTFMQTLFAVVSYYHPPP